jgi:hypothetical protein
MVKHNNLANGSLGKIRVSGYPDGHVWDERGSWPTGTKPCTVAPDLVPGSGGGPRPYE